MSESSKAEIIRQLFEKRWQGKGKGLTSPQVTLKDIDQAIREYNGKHRGSELSTRNPANFFKDFVRNKASANRNWPETVSNRGYTARQVTGGGLCFEFIPLFRGQAEPFPLSAIHRPGERTETYHIQSASMPLASRRLGRRDEAWLIQVLARLHIVETHLALRSPHRFVQVDLLQTNVKLARAEIDAMYLGLEEVQTEGPPEYREVIVTCEAKGIRDDILEDQLLAQVRAAFRMRALHQTTIIPVAVKAVGPSRIYVVQFASLDRGATDALKVLSVESEAIYVLQPPVPGVGK